MPDGWRSEWVSSKVSIAKQLGAGRCGGGYPEAILILCSALSAMASEKWPGFRKDKRRFVELLFQFADPSLSAVRISIPLLAAHLDAAGRNAEGQTLRRAFMPVLDTRVITGDDVDRLEGEVTAACASLESSLVRRFSYATLLYEETRSSYVHEYTPGPRSDSWAMGSARAHARVSYVNRLDRDDTTVKRLIHFSVDWLSDLALSVERGLRPLAPDDGFSNWWLPE